MIISTLNPSSDCLNHFHFQEKPDCLVYHDDLEEEQHKFRRTTDDIDQLNGEEELSD